MKGSEYFIVATMVGVFVFVVLFAGGTYFILERATETQIVEVRTSEELRVTGAAYVIEKCLSEGEYMMNSSLTEKLGKDMLAICKINFGAKVEDIENKREWDFGFDDDSKYKKTISVNIGYRDLNEVHIGSLHVSA